MDINYFLPYLSLLFTNQIDNALLMKLVCMFAVYLITNSGILTNIRTYFKRGDVYNRYNYKYSYGYIDCTVYNLNKGTTISALIDYISLYILENDIKNVKSLYYERNMLITQATDIQIGTDILLNIYTEQIKMVESSSNNRIFEVNIEISTKQPLKVLDDFMKGVIDRYELKTNEARKKTKYISILVKVTGSSSYNSFSQVFSSSKTFDNLYFENKNILVSRLNYFLNNVDNYKKLGIPHTLGILLSGIPGSAKTSIIKAIANHTKRGILIINTNIVTDLSKLESLLSETNHIKNNILVIEEIDCGGWKHVVKSRDIVDDDEKVVFDEFDKSKIGDKEYVKDFVEQSTKPKITLGGLLEFMDGIIEYPGRIIVMTTNKPEYIDKAILRPGRIDLHLQLNKLNKNDVNSLFKLWFDKDIPEAIFADMKDYKFTQAEIGKLFACQNIHQILDALVAA